MRAFVLCILFFCGVCLPAHADLLLDLRFTDSTTSKTVFSGETVMVDLILRDPSGDTFISLEGLGSGGGAVIASGSAVVTPSSPPVEGPEFDPIATFSGAALPRPGLIDSVFVAPFIPVPAGLGATDVLLATFSFVATGAAGDIATLTADVLDPTHTFVGNETFASFTDLDALLTDLATTPSNFGSVNLSIAAAVPEPATIVTGLMIGGVLVWRRRKITSALRG